VEFPLSFLEQLQGIIERTYAYESAMPDLGAFVIGDRGARILYGLEEPAPLQAKLLLRASSDGRVRARIYYPDALVRLLETHHPLRALHSGNIDALMTLVEELDHFLLLVDRAHKGTPTSLLEMEFQANITKVLVTRQILARHLSRPLQPAETHWIRWHVLDKGRFTAPEPHVRQRYTDARRLARGVLRHLDGLEAHSRLCWLREFVRTPGPRRIRQADLLAAA